MDGRGGTPRERSPEIPAGVVRPTRCPGETFPWVGVSLPRDREDRPYDGTTPAGSGHTGIHAHIDGDHAAVVHIKTTLHSTTESRCRDDPGQSTPRLGTVRPVVSASFAVSSPSRLVPRGTVSIVRQSLYVVSLRNESAGTPGRSLGNARAPGVRTTKRPVAGRCSVDSGQADAPGP